MTGLPIVRACGGLVILPLGELVSVSEAHEDWETLARPNPARTAAVRSDDPRARFLPELISSLVIDGNEVRYPAAAAAVYRRRLRGKLYTLVDDRPRFGAEPRPFAGTLATYQATALEALLQVNFGLLIAPCGAGKTFTLVALVLRIGLPTAVFVRTLEQAADYVDRFKENGVTAGIVGGGEVRFARVTVIIVQAVTDALIEEIAARFEVVVSDEVHHAAAETELAIWRCLRARRFHGGTATLREDGLMSFVHDFFGPVVAEITRADLVAAGRSVEPSITEVESSSFHPYDGPSDWPGLLDALEHDEARNGIIVDTTVREGAGELSAILTGRISHAEHLGEMLRSRGKRVEVLSSKRTKKARAQAFAAARAGEIDVICGTQLLDEAVDLPRLSRVVLAWPARAEGRLVQRVGRALRVCEGKASPRIFDIVDSRIGVLCYQAGKRRAIFRKHWPSQVFA